jgi:hypothetical protein
MFLIIKETLITAKEDLSRDAKQIEKEFWDQHHETNNKLDWSEKGKIGFRVRVRERGDIPSLDIEWFKMYFIKDKDGKYTMRSTYIRKGKGSTYSIKSFKKLAQKWEIPIIEEAERKLSHIRECSKNIGKLSVIYGYLNKSYEKYQEVMNGQ